MINYNGHILPAKKLDITIKNRAFKYGDAIFETIKYAHNKLIFFEDHYFRLMASMRVLRMKIPMNFTLEFLEEEILKTIAQQEKNVSYRIRLSVFRKDGGFYNPITNEINYLIEITSNSYTAKENYYIDLFKDFYNYSGMLTTIKTTNRILNTLASIFASENDLDNCVLLNERKSVVEVTNANIFLIKGEVIKTPALTEGCINGIIRKKVIEIIKNNPNFSLEETVISPFEIQKADEVFITNAIIGIQSVTRYRKKIFSTVTVKKIQNSLQLLEITT